MKNRKKLILIFIIFILINFVFNFQTFKDLISTQFYGSIYISDYTMSEYVLENMFTAGSKLFYPYQIDLTAFGIGPNIFILFYLFFRIFLNPTASMMMIGLSSFWLSSFLMFLLLRKLKINLWISFIISLVFSYMPFLSYQIGAQFSFTMVYFFPLLFLIAHSFILSIKEKDKFVFTSLFGVTLGLLFYTNLYYFLMSSLAMVFYSLYYLFINRRALFLFISENTKFLLLLVVIVGAFIIPWIYRIRQIALLDGVLSTPGFGGAIVFSSDLLSLITPSEYNPLYKTVVSFLSDKSIIFMKYSKFFFSNAHRVAYPGLIVLGAYLYIFLKRKKLGVILWENIRVYLYSSFFFALIMLGPFLKVINRWMIPLEEGIYLVLPLPFLAFHYIPFFNNIRAPQRFVPIFVFFAVIVAAYILNSIYSKVNKKTRLVFIYFLLTIFILDQFYTIPPKVNATLPNSIYQYVKSDKNKVSVMEIPYTVRDGIEYIGFVHAISPIKGALIHNKAVIGGYLPRINPYIFEYYRGLPFSGYIAKIIDKGNYNPTREKPLALKIIPFEGSINLAREEIEFLDIKYIILKNNEKYTENVKNLINKLGFIMQNTDGDYDLYETKLTSKTFESVNFGNFDDNLFTAAGFSFREDGFRWTQGKLAKVFLKTTNLNKKNLIFEGLSFYQPQKIKVYINKKYIGEKNIVTKKQKYIFDIEDQIDLGINTIYFEFSKSFRPSEVFANEKDSRDLSVKFYSLKLE